MVTSAVEGNKTGRPRGAGFQAAYQEKPPCGARHCPMHLPDKLLKLLRGSSHLMDEGAEAHGRTNLLKDSRPVRAQAGLGPRPPWCQCTNPPGDAASWHLGPGLPCPWECRPAEPGAVFKNPPAGDLERAAPQGRAFLPGMWLQVRPVWAGQPGPCKSSFVLSQRASRRVQRPHISANFGLTFPFSPGQSQVFAQGPEEWDHTRCQGARLRARPALPGTCSSHT